MFSDQLCQESKCTSDVTLLTLIVDKAVGSQQFKRVHLKQDPVKQQVMGRGSLLGIHAYTRLGELLQQTREKGGAWRVTTTMGGIVGGTW